ncbi:MAG: 5-(carboxyamino)imidazole ribonucleotide synthase [Gammaproteobacteria bacterium]|nr:5-(carboxyamino)imidazole ribonucleotide synthase [Gammaproteobacteria bacterium]
MRIGIVGAGQLGRMMALAGYPLGCRFFMYDRSHDTPGGQVAPIVTGEFDDARRLVQFAKRCEVVTFDWENVPVASAELIAQHVPVWPPPRALAIAQDRVPEKTLFRKLRIPTPDFAAVDSLASLKRAVRRLGLPGVLKTRRLGYDGKGQAVLRRLEEIAPAFEQLGSQPLVYEAFVRFSREVSLVAVRGHDGEIAFYPLAENVHEAGVLSVSRAPYVNAKLQAEAERHMRRVLEHFDYVGVLTIEFFVEKGRLVANEMAPRVHNSGHWTIEGAETSQFENHVRALAGLPLGSTRPRGHSVMVNLLGEMPPVDGVLAIPGVHLHDYGKEARPGRKLGHLTFVSPSKAERDGVARALLAIAGRDPG